MLVVLFGGLMLLAIVLGLIVEKSISDDYNDSPNWVGGVLIAFIFFSILLGAGIGASYNSTVDLKVTYEGIVAQYKDAIIMYEGKAIIDTEQAFTDFKYEGYQENMAGFIKELRTTVVEYNRILLQKKHLRKNIFSGILINYDDKLPTISMKD